MKTPRGFTLLELLVTLAIVALLATLSLGSNSYIKQKNEQTRLVDDLKQAIAYSKIQAIQLGKPVVLEPLDNNENWAKGVILKTQHSKEIIYQWQWHYPQWELHWRGVHSTQQILFSNTPANAISNGTFQLKQVSSNLCATFRLNRLGRIRRSENPIYNEAA